MGKVRVGISFIILLLISLPYVQAERSAGQDMVFGGFFLNPIDGNTYLAKMRQGWEGAWQFHLSYTADPGEGSYLFTFYLFLGHVAKTLGLSLLLTFHLARMGAALLLLLALDNFFRALFPADKTATLAFCLTALGAGMGWLAALTGWVSADLWVAEAYPFLASFSNPHFPLSLAIMTWLLTPGQVLQTLKPPNHTHRRQFRIDIHKAFTCDLYAIIPGFKAFIGGMILSLLSPFASIITGLVFAVLGIWHWLAGRKQFSPLGQPGKFHSTALEGMIALTGLALGSAPVVFYDFWIARLQPALAGWNAQNITPIPPIWDIVLSFSPALLFAVYAVWSGRRDSWRNSTYRLLIVWAGAGMLIFLPTNLQLRFIIGLYIPISGLAVMGVVELAKASSKRWRNLTAIIFGLSLPTILFIQLAATYTIQSRSNSAYFTQGEAQAMKWIDSYTPPAALILAGPDTGLIIPAYTNRRVIYGHPFETVNAAVEKASVEAFFRTDSWNKELQRDFLMQRKVEYIFFGPRERSLGKPRILDDLWIAYKTDDVTIYAVHSPLTQGRGSPTR